MSVREEYRDVWVVRVNGVPVDFVPDAGHAGALGNRLAGALNCVVNDTLSPHSDDYAAD